MKFSCTLLIVHLVLLSFYFASSHGAIKPGFKGRITQRALEYANQQAIDILAQKASSAPIPDQSGSSGEFDYQITNIRLTGLTKPSSAITIVPGTGLAWAGNNAGVSLRADWRVKTRGWIKVSFSGSVDASVSGVNFGTTMVIGADAGGRPSISCGACSCSVGSVSIDIHGDLDFLLNLFKGLIEDKIRDAIPGAVCSGVTQAINTKAEQQLRNLEVTVLLLDDLFTLDYRLVSSPSFQRDLETFHQGEITWSKDPKTPPFSPEPFPAYPSSDRMLYLWVGKYVPESFLYAAQTNGFLQYIVKPSDLPPEQRGFLNTTCSDGACIGFLFPAIAQKYPNSTVVLRMNSTSLPKVNMGSGQLSAAFTGDIALYAHTAQGAEPYLLTINVSALFNMTAQISNQLIKGNISSSSFKVGVLDSAIGPVQAGVLNVVMKTMMNFFIIPTLNAKGNAGFPLPVTGDFTFSNTQLQIQQDSLMVATDLQYRPH